MHMVLHNTERIWTRTAARIGPALCYLLVTLKSLFQGSHEPFLHWLLQDMSFSCQQVIVSKAAMRL